VDEANLQDEERGETGIAATLRLDYVEDVRVQPAAVDPALETPAEPEPPAGEEPQ
jgi:hypothetical protein